jgi:hypothetical protein
LAAVCVNALELMSTCARPGAKRDL